MLNLLIHGGIFIRRFVIYDIRVRYNPGSINFPIGIDDQSRGTFQVKILQPAFSKYPPAWD